MTTKTLPIIPPLMDDQPWPAFAQACMDADPDVVAARVVNAGEVEVTYRDPRAPQRGGWIVTDFPGLAILGYSRVGRGAALSDACRRWGGSRPDLVTIPCTEAVLEKAAAEFRRGASIATADFDLIDSLHPDLPCPWDALLSAPLRHLAVPREVDHG